MRLYLVGPFNADLRPTQIAAEQNPPERLFAGLLAKAANSLGAGYVESPRTASDRRPVRLARTNPQRLVIPHPFSFRLPGCGLIEQLGLFDADGTLLFFGSLRSARQAVERPEVFEFEEAEVQIRHQLVEAI